MTSSEILGVVLAGGRSRRLGRDKALLPWAGSTLAERAAEVLGGVLGEVVIAGPADLAPAGLEAVPDRVAGAGPLAGLQAGLERAAGRAIFALACDLPFVDRALVRYLVAAASPAGTPPAAAWAAADGGRVQPLCGVYAPAAAAEVERRLRAGRLAVLALFEAVGGVAVPIRPHFEPYRPELLLNLNRPEDLRRARRLRRAAGAAR